MIPKITSAAFVGLLLTLQPTLQEGCPSTEDTPTPEPSSDYERFQQLLVDLEQATTDGQRESLTSTFFSSVAYSDGFPIVEGGAVTFVYLQEMGVNEPLRVSGEFNNWSSSGVVMTRAVSDYWLYYATVSITDLNTKNMYKFVGRDGTGADLFFADSHARRYGYDSYGEYSLIRGGSQAEGGHLERYPAFHSDALDNERDLALYLPPGYDLETGTYPVLYMHDGQNLFDPAAYYGGWKVDEVIDDLVSRGRMAEVVVVGMANTIDRMDEYTHCEDYLPSDGGMIGGDAPLYADFIVDQVKPFIDGKYRTQTERESTGVLGSSLGGLVSFYIGYAYSDVFGLVGGMSSTLGWGSFNLHNPTMIELLEDAPKLPNIYYLDSGGGPGVGCVDSDGDGIEDDSPNSADNYCETAQLLNVLTAKGYADDELLYVYSPGQEHNEASWNSRLHYPLTFFFPAP